MKLKFLSIAALLLACVSCVEIDYRLGNGLLPIEQNRQVYMAEIPVDEILLGMPDSLSGYSNYRIVVGSIRDEYNNVSRRSGALTILPLLNELDFGVHPEFKSFHLALANDTISVADLGQQNILQQFNVYELDKPLDPFKDYNCNARPHHSERIVAKSYPIVTGKDSLRIDFSEEYAKKFFSLTKADLSDIDKYLAKIPGIYIESQDPMGAGGRFNSFGIQFGFDATTTSLSGNYGILNFRSTYNGVKVDTSFMFYVGAQDIYNIDSLLTHTSTGMPYPQYAMNFTDEEFSRSETGEAGETFRIRGGGGIKPRISAVRIKKAVKDAVASMGINPDEIIMNKATIILPFEFPEDYRQMFKYPLALSPTTRIRTDSSATFMGLTDASSSTEDQGDIDRNEMCYHPDFTFHMQEILSANDTIVAKGNHDIWLMTMTYEITSEDNSNSDLSQLYEQMAYESYYQSMYGGYGGYGYGGYGGYGNYGYNSYNNYYSYMMMAQYAGNNVSSYSTLALDKDAYYDAVFCGPSYPDEKLRPKIKFVFSAPKKAN